MKYLLLVAAFLFSAVGVQAADIEAGKAKTATCSGCHGLDGKTPIQDTYPKLAGQNAGYLEVAITAYKKGDRKGGNAKLMKSMVAGLSKADIKNVAAYFASLPAADAPAPAAEPAAEPAVPAGE